MLGRSTKDVRLGKTALSQFIANKGTSAVDDALSIGKEFAEAEAKLERAKKSRIDILHIFILCARVQGLEEMA